MPAGHVAAAYLAVADRRHPVPSRLGAAVTGALLPDLIDKTAMWLGLTPYGRTVGHSLLLWVSAMLVVVFLPRSRRASSAASFCLVCGGISHLVGDLVDDAVEGVICSGIVASNWMSWPFSNPDMGAVRVAPLVDSGWRGMTVFELLVVLVASVVVVRRQQRRS